MKQNLLLAFFIQCSFFSIAQINFGDFETWDQKQLFQMPRMGPWELQASNYETFLPHELTNVTKVQGQTGLGLRVENIEINEESIPGYFIMGSEPEQQGESVYFDGGVSLSNGNISGLSLDLRHSLSPGNTGIIVIQFKHNNELIGEGNAGPGTYVFEVNGEQLDWFQQELIFDPAPHEDADKCAMAFASANLLDDDLSFVVGDFIEIDNLEFIDSPDPIYGGHFELWNYIDPLYIPRECEVSLKPGELNFTRSLDANSGFYALEVKTIEENGEVLPGEVIYAQKTDSELTPNIYIGDKEILSFNYKYLASDDIAEVKLDFLNMEEGAFNTVHSLSLELLPTMDYASTEINFKEELDNLGIDAGFMIVTFKSSKDDEGNVPQPQSSLLVDDMQLEDMALSDIQYQMGVEEMYSITAYPNPTKDFVNVTFNGGRQTGTMTIFNSTGQAFKSFYFNNESDLHIDLSHYPAGKYLFGFQTDVMVKSLRVMKLR